MSKTEDSVRLYDVSIYDVVKLLFEMKKDQHAERVLDMVGQIKLLQGKLERFYEETTPPRAIKRKDGSKR